MRRGMNRRVGSVALVIASSLVLACGDDPSGPGGATPPAEVTSATVTMGANPLVRDLAVDLDGASGIRVDYWTAARPTIRREVRRGASAHALLLTRLIPDALYEYEVSGLGSDGRLGEAFSGQFTTGSLPDDLAAFSFTTRGRTTEPLIMAQLRSTTFNGWVILNEEGDVVWFWRARPGPLAYTQRENKNFVFIQGTGLTGERVTEVNARGQIVNELTTTSLPHHDVITTPQNTLLFLGQESRTINDTTWVGDAILEWSPEGGTETKLWNVFDFMSPQEDLGNRSGPGDWTHANAIAFGPRGNIVVSFFFLPQVISIAADFQSIEWRMYGPRATITASGDAVAYGTHTAAEIAPNRVLMFDNGVNRPEGAYSRALEVEIDPATGTATKVWDFRPTQDNYSSIISSARRLPNGNTMVAFGPSAGLVGSSGPIEAYEVTETGRVVWYMAVEGPRNMYRATPLSDINGEVEVPE